MTTVPELQHRVTESTFTLHMQPEVWLRKWRLVPIWENFYESVRHRYFSPLPLPPFWSTNISGFLIPTVPCPHFENTGQWLLMTTTVRLPLFLLMVRERSAICCHFWCARCSINALVHYPSSMILMRLSVILCFIASVLQTRAGAGGVTSSLNSCLSIIWGQMACAGPFIANSLGYLICFL